MTPNPPSPNPPMVVAECQKMLDIQCIWGRIFVSLEKILVFKYSDTIFHLVFCEIYMEKVLQELFWAHFFVHQYHSNGTKIHLDAALIAPVLLYWSN